MINVLEEKDLCDLMVEVELLLEYRNFDEASVRLEKILLEHPEYLPAKEAFEQVCRLTGQTKKTQDLQKEIKALSDRRAKEQLSTLAKAEYGKIERRRFAEKVEHLTKVIYQGRTVEEVLSNAATELLDLLKSDRCFVFLVDENKSNAQNYEYCHFDVSPCLDQPMTELMLGWLEALKNVEAPVVLSKLQADPGWAESRPLLEQHQIHAIMAFPLVHKSIPMGWLLVQQCVPYYTWDEDDHTLFSAVSGHLASAIQSLRIFGGLQEKAYTDNLTGLYNRHFLQERLLVELGNAQRLRYPLCLAMLDIDHFKQINDTYGHLVGDSVLVKLAYLLKTNVRKGCVVARWGGEEFLVVFPRLELEAVAFTMGRFREKVYQTIEIEGRCISVSVGVAQADLASHVSLEQIQSALIHEADNHLYAAKRNGRNQVIFGAPTVATSLLSEHSFNRSEGADLLHGAI